MRGRVCIDTNVFIAVKNREKGYEFCERILDDIDDGKLEGVVSTIVIAETLVGFYKKNEKLEAKKFLNHLLHRYDVRPVDINIAELASRIRMKGLKMPDAIVVATAKTTDSILITKDYKIKYDGVKILSPEKFLERYGGEV